MGEAPVKRAGAGGLAWGWAQAKGEAPLAGLAGLALDALLGV